MSRFALSLCLLFATLALAQETVAPKLPVLGTDPLPAKAERRLGTNRLRLADRAGYFMFSPDNSTLMVGSITNVHFWRTSDWKEAWRTEALAFTCSPDGTHVAKTTSDKTLEVWDMKAQKLVFARDLSKSLRNSRIFDIEFDATGDHLWVGASREGMLQYEWRKDAIKTTVKLMDVVETSLIHSRDRKVWALRDGEMRVKLFEADGTSRRNLEFDRDVEWFGLNHDGSLVATVSKLRLHLWDTATGDEVDWLPNDAKLMEQGGRVVFDARGANLLILSSKLTPLDLKTKKLGAPLTFDGPQPTALAISNDNKMLAIGYDDGAVEIRDPVTFKRLIDDPYPRGQSSSIAFARDGQSLATFHHSKAGVRLWNLRDGAVQRTFDITLPNYARIDEPIRRDEMPEFMSLAFLPDNQRLALGMGYRWNLTTGERDKPAKRKDRLERASGDGKRWIVVEENDNGEATDVALFDPVAGKEIAKLDIDLSPETTVEGYGLRGALSASGDVVAVHRQLHKKRDPNTGEAAVVENSILVWRLDGGKAIKSVNLPILNEEQFSPIDMSPDGRLLASIGAPSPERPHQAWHVPSGFLLWKITKEDTVKMVKLPGDVDSPIENGTATAFSPDGQFLATPVANGIALREALSGTILETFTGQDGWIRDLAFSPDGLRLASASSDSTVMLWKVPTFPSAKPGVWKAGQGETLWNGLRGEAPIAYQAIADLTAGGDEAVGILKDKLRPESDNEGQQIRQALADLGSPIFLTREKATIRLEKWGHRLKPYLAEAIAQSNDLEQKRRLAFLHDRYKNIPLDVEELRRNRANVVLERIGTPAARLVLEGVARGPAQELAAQSARASLARLAK